MSAQAPSTDGSISRRLSQLARDLLAEAVRGPNDRKTAITLLAADALMTLACEAQAEHDPQRLGTLTSSS